MHLGKTWAQKRQLMDKKCTLHLVLSLTLPDFQEKNRLQAALQAVSHYIEHYSSPCTNVWNSFCNIFPWCPNSLVWISSKTFMFYKKVYESWTVYSSTPIKRPHWEMDSGGLKPLDRGKSSRKASFDYWPLNRGGGERRVFNGGGGCLVGVPTFRFSHPAPLDRPLWF